MTSNAFGTRAIKKNWQKIQGTTFRNWINERLKLNSQGNGDREPIRDLALALKDGLLLVELVENLEKGQKKVKGYSSKPRAEAQKFANLFAALQFIKDQGIKLVNIGNCLGLGRDIMGQPSFHVHRLDSSGVWSLLRPNTAYR